MSLHAPHEATFLAFVIDEFPHFAKFHRIPLNPASARLASCIASSTIFPDNFGFSLHRERNDGTINKRSASHVAVINSNIISAIIFKRPPSVIESYLLFFVFHLRWNVLPAIFFTNLSGPPPPHLRVLQASINLINFSRAFSSYVLDRGNCVWREVSN